MGVRVLAVSDEVDDGLAAGLAVRSADLILACGDLPASYLAALMNALDAPLVFVPGNHDPDQSGYRQTRAGIVTLAGLPAAAPWPQGGISADGRVVDAAGLRIAGLGGCLRYCAGPNQYTERQQARRAQRLRRLARRGRPTGRPAVDVLMTHAPPLGLGDGNDRPHRGFRCYHGLIADLAPAALLHGHVRPPGDRAAAGLAAAGLAAEGLAGHTAICNVSGWRLLDLTPGSGPRELREGWRHAI